jgi:hypothetical protein
MRLGSGILASHQDTSERQGIAVLLQRVVANSELTRVALVASINPPNLLVSYCHTTIKVQQYPFRMYSNSSIDYVPMDCNRRPGSRPPDQSGLNQLVSDGVVD